MTLLSVERLGITLGGLPLTQDVSLRHVDEILAARGVVVSHETIRQWGLKFGQAFANQIRRRLPQWHSRRPVWLGPGLVAPVINQVDGAVRTMIQVNCVYG